MTHDEAIHFAECLKHNYTINLADMEDFCDIVIESLKKEPSEDAVSRSDVMALIERTNLKYLSFRRGISQKAFEDLLYETLSLPPVTPKGITVTDFADKCRECGAKYGKLLKQYQARKGKWLKMSDEQEDDRYKCSCCGNVVHYKDKTNLYTFNNWCGRCGSDNTNSTPIYGYFMSESEVQNGRSN